MTFNLKFVHIQKINIEKYNKNSFDIYIYSKNGNCNNCTNLFPFDNVLILYISNSGKI